MAVAPRQILVTSALPYANGAIHIGHLVEYIQTDIWVRFQKMRGHAALYVCGDDAHGTPIMLRAKKEGVEPKAFIARMNQQHQEDFARFEIAFDSYYSTDSEENRKLTTLFYQRLLKAGHIVTHEVEQFFDPVENVFLPDRFIRGTCPNCKTPDQYGDSCENCGKHYEPTDLINPRSAISGAAPVRRKSPHFFLRLEHFRARLQRLFETDFVDPASRNKLLEWFGSELKDWDISRDAPFFGFPIPGEEGKYFYNWFDAPIGYLASLANALTAGVDESLEFWQEPAREIVHFIGKDIPYFHGLFWPAMLEGAGLRLPNHLFIHGFLTVNGEKMSKSRGTFINAGTYCRHLDPQYLRYYFASKLSGTSEDLDLSVEDFVARVNSELVGKLANLLSRSAVMLSRSLEGRTGVPSMDSLELLGAMREASEPIAAAYEQRNFALATRQICALADRANKFLEDQAPWKVLKRDPEAAGGILTAALEAGRILTIYLKPIVPQFAERVEACLKVAPLEWKHVQDAVPPRKIGTFERLVDRLDMKKVEAMIEDSKQVDGAAKGPATTVAHAQSTVAAAGAGATQISGGAGSPGAPTAAQTATGASAAAAPVAPGVEPLAPVCSIDQFMAVDLRVARVLSAQPVAGTDKMMEVRLDVGALGQRTVFAGIQKAYTPARLENRLVVFCANLAPRKMKFGTSEGMVLASGPGGPDIFVLSPDAGAQPGQRVH